ncbi:MAG: VIT1/CCC1 transporter family protein [Planctomycetes bacterium]|nr:VIT1/CCC1 transporter family protein [Planctomycetota bacterium]
MHHLRHHESHRVARVGWLRAGVLGANDGIVSTASLIVGFAASEAGQTAVLLAGAAGLVAGALSMACGEFLSVSSQRDTEEADLARERQELVEQPEQELRELAKIYETRGLETELARLVAERMTAHDALGAHARDELGISEELRARPMQAAIVSASSFASGAALPLATAAVLGEPVPPVWIGVAALFYLAMLGGIGAHLGGAAMARPVFRVVAGGVVAMAATAAVGLAFGIAA